MKTSRSPVQCLLRYQVFLNLEVHKGLVGVVALKGVGIEGCRGVIIVVVDRAWSPDEDQRLAELVQKLGAGNWALSESVCSREWAGTTAGGGAREWV